MHGDPRRQEEGQREARSDRRNKTGMWEIPQWSVCERERHRVRREEEEGTKEERSKKERNI